MHYQKLDSIQAVNQRVKIVFEKAEKIGRD